MTIHIRIDSWFTKKNLTSLQKYTNLGITKPNS